jgi:uncharacterized protein with GYD domain
MATYVTLLKFTDQGVQSVKQTVSRADAAREAASRFGVTLKSIHWTQGQYDVVAVWEAADETAFTAFGLTVAMAGNVPSETLRAFDRNEMSAILAKLP